VAGKLRTVALMSLVEDFHVYPRHAVSSMHVLDIVRALEAGQDLPPPVVDAKTLRVVDGFHRVRALRRHLGDDAKVQVDARTYDSDAALFIDAATLNASHGRRLDRHDQVRVIYRARELGADDHLIAVALAVPDERVTKLEVRIATGPAGESVATKLGATHLGGRTLDDEQVKALREMRGAQISRPIREITRQLEAGIVNLDDPTTREQLLHLAELIQHKVGALAIA
jgi:hypothetical protein